MQLRVSSPGHDLKQPDIDRIQRDLEKIDRRLSSYDEVYAEVRVSEDHAPTSQRVTLEVRYGRNHLVASATNHDMGRAIREAREEIVRQINDRSRGGHSSFSKRA